MNNKIVYSTISILVVLAGLFAFININTQNVTLENDSISVMLKGNSVGQITMAEVKKLPTVKKEVTIRSSSEGTGTYTFTGTPVQEVLRNVSPDIKLDGSQVIVKGIDGYNVVFEGKELLSNENVLLVYAQDDKPLGSKTKGGTGPFRLIVLGDQFGLRAVKYVNQLEVN